MNSPDTEYEQTLASPSERSHYIEMDISQHLDILREQVDDVNSRLATNLRILNEKKSENLQLKQRLAKMEINLPNNEINQSTDVTLSSEGSCVSCKSCLII